MFEPFSSQRLASHLTLHPLTDMGRRYVNRVLDAPTGNAQGGIKIQKSDLTCPKMHMGMQSNQASFQPLIRELIFSERCLGYLTRPPSVELIYQGKNGARVRTHHQPSCLVFDAVDGTVLEDWLPAKDRETLQETSPGRYERADNGIYRSPPMEAALAPLGIKHRVRFTDDFDEIADANRKCLRAYLYPEAEENLPALRDMLAKLGTDVNAWEFGDLLKAGYARDTIFYALAVGHLHCDLSYAEILREAHNVMIFRDQAHVQAWRHTSRGNDQRARPSDRSALTELEVGDEFEFDGVKYTVKVPGGTALHALTRAGVYVQLPFDILLQPNAWEKLVLPSARSPSPAPRCLWQSSGGAVDRAINKVVILGKIDAGETLSKEDQHSPSTFRAWRRTIREGELAGIGPVEALLDSEDGKGYRGSHIDHELSLDINALIRKALDDNMQPTIAKLFGDIRDVIESGDRPRKMIARSSFYERAHRLRELSNVAKSEGHKVAYQHSPVYWMLDLDTPVHCQRAFELVHIDSTHLDIEVRSSLSGDELGKPWLTLAMCAHTRRVIGFVLSFRPPSYVSSMGVIADIVKRCGRLPESICVDHGSEFKAIEFRQMLISLVIDLHVRPKSAARFGAILERMFGIVTKELLSGIAGNTKARKRVRSMTAQVDPSTHSGLTLMDLYAGLDDFFNQYNARKHPKTLRKPDEHYDESLAQGGFRTFRVRRRDDILPLLAPTAKFKTRSVDSARGLYVNYRWYGHPSLAKLSLDGSELDVKVVPWDPSVILCFNYGEWVTCRSDWTTDMHQLPEYARACIFEEWLIEVLLVRASKEEARKEVKKLMDRLNEAAKQNRAYWEDPELADAFPLAHDAPPPQATADESDPQQAAESNAAAAFLALIHSKTQAILVSDQYGATA